ncbi:hypothetical protein OIU78_028987 [Salix suchowensis]|nr:hypothetical protein OIU78_028987 [Salix suchowensis]
MEWFVVFWILVGISAGWCWYRKEKSSSSSKKNDMNMEQKSGVLPKGSFGWPLIGETLDFIAAGYTSQPVSFMEKRRSL